MIDGASGVWGAKECSRRRQRRELQAYAGESHESFAMSDMCQYKPLKVTVGDVLVFNKAAPDDDVFDLPSQWHYAHCNFSDGGARLPLDPTSSDAALRYTVRPGSHRPSLSAPSSPLRVTLPGSLSPSRYEHSIDSTALQATKTSGFTSPLRVTPPALTGSACW